MNRKLQLFHEKLGRYYIPLISFFLAVLIGLLGYEHVQPDFYNFQLNQVAEETILAPVTMEDVEETEASRQRARETINEIYVYQPEIRTRQLNTIEEFFSMIRQMRNNTYSTQSIQELLDEYGLNIAMSSEELEDIERSSSQELTFSQLEKVEQDVIFTAKVMNASDSVQVLVENLTDSAIQQTFSLSAEQLSSLQAQITDIVSVTLEEEMMASELNTHLNQIQQYVNRLEGWSIVGRQTVINFAENLIRPTMAYSEIETDLRRDEAAAQVQPSYILQGQVIIQEGHIIQEHHLRQLDLYGYLDATSNNMLRQAFYALVVVHAIIMSLIFSNFFKVKDKELAKANMQITAYSIILAITLVLVKITQFLQNSEFNYAGILVPMTLIPIMLKPKSDLQKTLLATIFVNLFSLFIVNDSDNQTVVTFVSLFYMFTTILSLFVMTINRYDNLQYRQKFIYLLMWIYVIALPLMVAINIPILSEQGMRIVLLIIANIFIVSLIHAIFEPYWETLLSRKAPLTMNQLANLNHPLLKLLIEKAPGSYHHSILVANLAANAVEEIGGDSLLTRVAAYYHDIGKTVHPLFFVENLSGGIESPHQMIGPDESASIIIDHVKQGVRILEEYEMPQSIIDVCQEHHGTTLTQYFYFQAKQEKLNLAEDNFRYPGPKPQTKESAVMMIADSLEAASRSLKDHSQQSIENLVDNIIQGKIQDGQFSACGLTVDELRMVRKSLVSGLASMYHTRIEYPK